ncbi:MAG: 1,2-phenylacetyl-CoA epoxidase subunit A [Chloroflexota bacterium]
MATALATEDATLKRLKSGKLVEGVEHMSPTYLEGITRILTVSADTELISAPAYFRAAQDAPSLNAFGSAISIVQDELAHAHIAYRLLEDLGVDKEWLIYQRPAHEWKYPYAFDVPLDTWYELVVANAFYDQAGYELLSDVYHSTTFGPWKRALAKVDKEETFHLRHGQQWIKRFSSDPTEMAHVQRAADWMFLLTVEWFGLPDANKRHAEQLDYGFKGRSNDQLRQAWMAKVIPFCEEVGLRVPARRDPDSGAYVLDVPFPARFDAAAKRWVYEEGPIGWDAVVERWKARGPMNTGYVASLQRGWNQASEA